jgi:hypothetical protein
LVTAADVSTVGNSNDAGSPPPASRIDNRTLVMSLSIRAKLAAIVGLAAKITAPLSGSSLRIFT